MGSLPRHVRHQRLATPLRSLPGVSDDTAQQLARLRLRTVRDLLFYFPRDYQDASDVRPIAALASGVPCSVTGSVAEIDQRHSAAGRAITGVLLSDGREALRLVWFNQPFMAERFRVGQRLLVSGKPRRVGLYWEMSHPRVRYLEAGEEPAGQILPIYPLSEGLTQGRLHRLVRFVLEHFADLLDEVFPDDYLEQHGLWPLRRALPQMHFPDTMQHLAAARRRFVYQELFVQQLALALQRKANRQSAAPPLPLSATLDARIRRLFPFTLTSAQQQAIAEIAADMARPQPMNRLLQGEVGSGKTVVAAYAMLLAVAHGQQAALMAPTELLARQHFDTLCSLLAHSKVGLGLLVGGQTAAQRQEVLDGLAQGRIQLVVGTHALLRQEIPFHKLGLVVIDEQHKFGVRQRAMLRETGRQPHYLVMTATPIPRTLALTQYGDLEVSLLRESPPGRPAVHTYLLDEAQGCRWWEFFRKKLRQGRQGYVITPRVGREDEDADDALASAQRRYEQLANGELQDFRLGLVHGRLASAQRQQQMEAFRRGELQVLVATSVVEVGLDVPNATLMTIEDAQQFGLSSLHQLRGRIGRGTHPGYCGVFAAADLPAEARQRLQAFVESRDGFQLAELDFQLRGPGDVLGTRQHGLPPLRVADLRRDAHVLEEARRDASALVEQRPGLAGSEWQLMRDMVLRRYGSVLNLGDVG
jgi:ATP-dependent DNA helicase RecG